MKPTFNYWRAWPELYGHPTANLPPDEFTDRYAQLLREAIRISRATNPAVVDEVMNYRETLTNECLWHAHGRPYYKVWPGIADKLRHTKLSFSGEYVRTPYPAFSVMLPADRPRSTMLVGLYDKSYIAAPGTPAYELLMLLPGAKEQAEASLRLEERLGPLVIILSFRWMGTDKQHLQLNIPIYGSETVESALAKGFENQSDDQMLQEQKDMIRIAIGVAMFGVDRHELVAPDIDRQALEQRFPGGRSKALQQVARAAVEREIAKCKGWLVGSEIDLPRPLTIRSGGLSEDIRELEFGHIRSGHMRMQPCGPGNQDRKLIFVEPTVVRPDLPVRQTHGYRLHDKILNPHRD